MNSKASFSWAAPIFCLAAYFQWKIIEEIPYDLEFPAYLMLGAYVVMAIALFGKMYNILPVIGLGAGTLSTVLTLLKIPELLDFDHLLKHYPDDTTAIVVSYYIGQVLVVGAFVFLFLNIFFSIPQYSYLSNWDTVRGETLWYLSPILIIVGHILPFPVVLYMSKVKLRDFLELLEDAFDNEYTTIWLLLFLASISFSWGLACKWYADAGNRPIRHHRNVYNTNPYQQNPYQQPYQQNPYQQQPYQQQPYQQNPYQQNPYQQQPYQQNPYQQQPYQQNPYQQQPYQQQPYQQPQTPPQTESTEAPRQDG